MRCGKNHPGCCRCDHHLGENNRNTDNDIKYVSEAEGFYDINIRVRIVHTRALHYSQYLLAYKA